MNTTINTEILAEPAMENQAHLAILAQRLGCAILELEQLDQLAADFDLISYAEAISHQCIALRDGSKLLLVSSAPTTDGFLAWADAHLKQPFILCLAQPEDLRKVLARHSEGMRAMDSATSIVSLEDRRSNDVEELSLSSIHGDESSIVRLTNSTLYDAYKAGASDIHLETTTDGLRIKYRLDGVLSVIARVPGIATAEQAISRIKIMAELDIAERRVPQDGRIKVSIDQREVDLRVSIMPSLFGEDAVLRILDKNALTNHLSQLTLDFLGFDEETNRVIRRLAREPYGMLLVTGPTGSGKTTTLYAVISEINDGRDKIVTIEDPVEYQLHDVLQIPVNERKGLTFARGLRSILRHDPDRIMVGEMRDEETAQIAVQSALTGHLVLTTVHANNVFDVISRLLHMGIAPHSFASAINGIVAQRLIRINCPHCVKDVTPNLEMLAESALSPDDCQGFKFRAGSGCSHCRGTGYKGRRGIAEFLRFNSDLRDLIASGASAQRLRQAAEKLGMRQLRDAAIDLVKNGETTLEEINRVTFVA